MTTFEDLATTRLSAVPEDWMQGRALFGGAVCAAMLDAARDTAPDRHPISLQCTFAGPVGGPCTTETTVLREGRSYTHTRVSLFEGDTLRAEAHVAFATARPGITYEGDRVPLPDPAAATWWPYLDGVMPRFVQHFRMAMVEGQMPFSGQSPPEFAGWVQHQTAPGRSEEALLGLVDAWPPPSLVMAKGPVPSSSVHLAITFAHVPLRIEVDEPFWYHYAAGAIENGQAHTRGTMRDRAGRLVAHAQQLVAFYA